MAGGAGLAGGEGAAFESGDNVFVLLAFVGRVEENVRRIPVGVPLTGCRPAFCDVFFGCLILNFRVKKFQILNFYTSSSLQLCEFPIFHELFVEMFEKNYLITCNFELATR